ncbi:MAG: sodium:proton exchanger [Polyangiaceae bacterium]
MSGATTTQKPLAARLTQAVTLVAIFGLLWLAVRVVPEFHGAGTMIGALGFLLLAGTLTSELCEIVALPHLTGYILAGVVAGPHVLHLFDHDTVASLSVVNTLALSLIALAGGAELRLADLKSGVRSLSIAMLVQSVVVLALSALGFVLLARFIPFTQGYGLGGVVAIALLWGVLAVSRSPSATLAILSQTRAQGPVARFTLAFVMASDVVVLVLLAVAMMVARQLLEPSSQLSFEDFESLGHELLGSASLGTTLGLLLAVYLRFVSSELLVILVALGYGLTAGLHYLRFDPLLTFLIAGFVVQNFSNQGKKLLTSVEQTSAIVFVVFFASAGAHLDLALLRSLWPMAVALTALRAVATYVAHRTSTRLAADPPVIRRWGWAGFVSQAGLTLGLSAVLAKAFPGFGPPLRSLTVAVVALNEVVGPILFKLALDRTEESATAGRTSLSP